MELDIAGEPGTVTIGATGIQALIQQVQIVCATRVGTLPLDRSFGIDADGVDLPLPVAKARSAEAIVSGVEKYVPGVRVVAVTWKEDPDAAEKGTLIPIVRITTNES